MSENSDILIAHPLAATPQTRLFAFIPANGSNARSPDGSVSVQDIVNQVPQTAPFIGPHDAYVIVATTSNAETNGAALLAAYATAKTLLPNGSARSATNRVSVILPPGRFDLGEGELNLDASFIDVVGMTTNRENHYVTSYHTGSGFGTIKESAAGVRLANLTIDINGMNPWNDDGTDPAALYTNTPTSTISCTNVKFMVSDVVDSELTEMSAYVEFAGQWIDCESGPYSFGYDEAFSGFASNCRAGEYSFGTYQVFTGQAYNCVAGHNSFGYGTGASGVIVGCTVLGTYGVGTINPLSIVDISHRGGKFVFPMSAAVQPPKLIESSAHEAPWTVTDTLAAVAVGIKERFSFMFTCGIAMDSGGNVYASDAGNYVIRKIAVDGTVTVMAGTLGVKWHADGTVGVGTLDSPGALVFDQSSGNLYVVDTGMIRVIDSAGTISTLAGTYYEYASGAVPVDGTGSEASFVMLTSMTTDGTDLFVTDATRVRKVTKTGVVTTIAGSDNGSDDGVGIGAKFSFMYGIAYHGGNLYVLDTAYGVRKIDSGLNVTHYASLSDPWMSQSLCADSAGNLYASVHNRIYKIDTGAVVTVLAGNAFGGYIDATGEAARFNITGAGIVVSDSMRIIDTDNFVIRSVHLTTGVVTTVNGDPGRSGNINNGFGPTAGSLSNSSYTVEGTVTVEGDNVTTAAGTSLILSLGKIDAASYSAPVLDATTPIAFTSSVSLIGALTGYTGIIATISIPTTVLARPVSPGMPGLPQYCALLARLSAAAISGSVKITVAKLVAIPIADPIQPTPGQLP